MRNLNQIVKIDYQTKKIIWKLGENGDFRMFEMNGTEVTKLFSHQHDPEIRPNGNILLFDNGLHKNERKPYSRVTEIEITGQEFHANETMRARIRYAHAHLIETELFSG